MKKVLFSAVSVLFLAVGILYLLGIKVNLEKIPYDIEDGEPIGT